MSCVSLEQSFSYQSLFEVVRQEDFWALIENAAIDLQRLIYVTSKDLHRRFERLVFLHELAVALRPFPLQRTDHKPMVPTKYPW